MPRCHRFVMYVGVQDTIGTPCHSRDGPRREHRGRKARHEGTTAMRRLRLLVVLATTFMVAFTGMSTASARSQAIQAPEIVRVSNAYAGGNLPDTLKISVSYRCHTASGDNQR